MLFVRENWSFLVGGKICLKLLKAIFNEILSKFEKNGKKIFFAFDCRFESFFFQIFLKKLFKMMKKLFGSDFEGFGVKVVTIGCPMRLWFQHCTLKIR